MGTIAVAVAERDGELRSLGIVPNRLESIRKLTAKLVLQRIAHRPPVGSGRVVKGSKIGERLPLAVRVWEKLPRVRAQ